ncbi:PREDICTED: uncharacterized protein LOC105365146 [Ceratosolen solmsi marchali]|uniref:Uncharacterized protein LOC105365146 n=1 Tax=Ceratosolen solmsi marchali TaxID=326594 RepID=A0AAJ6YNY0_9HYME|nr:PREDICTED: uncharacterized protein LOC105365146 [Ceratosolen solmsi marchali]
MARSVLLVIALVLLEDTRTTLARATIGFDEHAVVDVDMVTVDSLRREVRQPAPQRVALEVSDLLSSSNVPKKTSHDNKHIKNSSGKSNEGGFYKTYGSDADGEKGYLKKTFSKGDHGYKTLDTFHKKLGDRYGFEEHEAFGKASDKEEEKQEDKSASTKHNHNTDHEGAGTDVETHYADDGEGDHSEYSDGGDSGHYSGDEGESDSYSESYSSSDGDGYDSGSAESYSSGGESSNEEDDGESYY